MGIFHRLASDIVEKFEPLSQAHAKRKKLFKTYWSYYQGDHKRHIKVEDGDADDNVILNFSEVIVDQSIDFLFGEELIFELDSNTRERTEAEVYLDDVFGEAEKKMMFLQEVAQNGGVTGTAFVRLYLPDPNVPDSLPRLVNLDPGIVDIIVSDDDATLVLAYHIVWESDGTWKRHRILRDVELNEWVIVPERAENNRRWLADGEEEIWPYSFAPIFSCQNLPLANSVWGVSDLRNADVNDAINRTASNTNRIIRFHAHPKTIGVGFAGEKLDRTQVNDFWYVDSTEANVFNLEMSSDLQSSHQYLQTLKTTFYKTAGASEFDPAVVNVGALSGFALRILYMPTLKRMMRKRNTYGAMLKDICRALLHLRNDEEQEVKIIWKDPLPDSGNEQAQALSVDRQNGLSQATYLERRGYDAEIEAEKRAKEQKEQQEAFRRNGALVDALNGFEDEDDE